MDTSLLALSRKENQDSHNISPKIILDYFRVELNRLEKERHGIIDEYLEVLRLKKIEVLEKSLGI